jgi:hypothetical protein
MTLSLLQAAAQHRGEPHEIAAWNQLEESCAPAALATFRSTFLAAPKPKAPLLDAASLVLNVPFESQMDDSEEAHRRCFSSSCAMVARYLHKVANDKEYNVIRARYGDTTSSAAQLQALRSLGLQARLVTTGTPAIVKALLREGLPVAVGWLHKGPVSAPTGGGHWSVITGYGPDHWIVHDPYGEADLANGGYLNHTKGKGIRYSFTNFNRRWEHPGNGNGWLMEIKPLPRKEA